MTQKTPPNSASDRGNTARALLIGTTCGIVGAPGIATAGPEGGVVTAGQGSIATPTSTSTVINQSSNSLSINWQSFDVASNESVSFVQPSSNAVALNRILDQKPSEVFGRIDSNGKVVLLNSNGIMFGQNAQLNVGSLLATSLNVISFDESTGHLSLSAAGTPGAIINNGTISAAPHGSVSLVGGTVANNGLIVAEYGTVNLAAGRAATLDFYGGGLLRFDADSALTSNGGAAAGVDNAGQIRADGGQVLLTTSAAQNVFDRAVNNDGLVRANRIDNTGGAIRLVGAGGTVVSSGELDASGVGADSSGGTVQVLGQYVGLFGNAVVDVSGDAGGGVALIGGDFQGSNPDVINARATIVAPGASIVADARTAGDGGRVIVWADEGTSYYGSLSARGGSLSGDGGFAEVSGKKGLVFEGTTDLSAANGSFGSLLLDPENISIQTNAGNATPNLNFADGPTNANVTPASIISALGTGSVLLQATDDITVNADVNAAGSPLANTLTLQAGDDVIFTTNMNIVTGGPISLITGGATPVSQTGTRDITFNTGSGVTAPSISMDSEDDINLLMGTVNSTGTVTLVADGLIEDGMAASITAPRLVINGANQVDLHANVGTLDAQGVTGAFLFHQITGNVTVEDVRSTGTVSIFADAGAILDDDEGTDATTRIVGSTIALDGATGVGSVADLRLGTGSSIDVQSAGSITVDVSELNGEINLNFFQSPTAINMAANAIDAGKNAGTAGNIVLLQSAQDINSSLFVDDSFDFNGTNTAQVGFRSNLTLTVGDDVADLFSNNDSPGTLAYTGLVDILQNDASPRDVDNINVGSLIFDSGSGGGDTTLSVNVGQLRAALGGTAELTVNETNAINLVDVVAPGTVRVDAGGAITVGVVTSTTEDVSLTAAGTISDDGDSSGRTRITATAGTVALAGTSIGGAAANAEIDTNAQNLSLNASTGDMYVLEQTGAAITNFMSAGTGTLSRIQTENGALTSAINIRPNSGNLELISNGTGVNVNYGAITLGRTTGPGNVIVRAGGDLTIGTVVSNGADLEAGASVGTGNLVVNNVGGTAGTVQLRAGGTITDNATVGTAAVVAGTLSVTRATSVDVDTNVNTLNASGVTGPLTVREQAGDLAVGTVNVTGAVDLSTTAGALNVTTLSGNGITLNAAGGGMTLGTVTSGAGAGDISLTATGLIDDGVSAAASVIGDELTIAGPGSVDLDTNVTTLDATGLSTLAIREQTGSLGVTNAVASGTVSVSTNNAALNLTTVSGTTVTLAAGTGAIADGAATQSVTANQLAITNAGSVNLDTDVNVLNAGSVGAGGLAIRDQAGSLTVTNATSTGAVDVTATTGGLTVTNANGNGVTLTAGAGAMALTTVNANGGTATLSATGAITGGPGAVAGNRLSVTQAASVNVETSVNTLNAIGVVGDLTVADANNITIETVTAGGAVALTSNAGAILDDDGGTSNATTISGSSVALTAATGIGSVTDFTTGAGSSVDVNFAAPGALSATVASNSGAINLNISGAPAIAAGGITLGSDPGVSTGTVVLQSGAALDLGGLIDNAISIGAGNTASVGYVSGGLLTLRSTGSVTDAAPLNLLVSGADIVSDSMTPRTIALTAGTLNFNASAAAGGFQLNTDVNFLNADVGAVALNVDQIGGAGDLTLGRIVSQSLDVDTQVANGAILDDGDDTTVLAGSSIRLSAGGSVGSNATPEDAIDVDTPSLFAASFGTGGDVVINSVRTGSTAFYVGASVDDTLAGNGDLTIRAVGDVSAQILQAVGDTVTVTTAGQIVTDAAAVTDRVVNADQLVVIAASAINLNGTNINTLNASSVTGPLSLTEATGPLTVANASATGAVNVATTDGALTVTSAASSGGATTLTAGGTGALSITNASGTGGLTASTVNGALTATTVSSSGGPLSLAAGGAGTLTIGTATALGAITGTTANGALNVTNAVTSTGGAVTLAASGTGAALTIANASGAGGLTASTVDGTLTATAVSSSGGPLSLTAGGTGALTIGSANAVGAITATTANGALNVMDAASSGGTTTLTAGGTGPLSITNASGASGLTASTVDGALTATTVSSSGGPLSLTAGGTGALTIGTANAVGAITATTANGALNVTTAVTSTAGTTTLTAGGTGPLSITNASGASGLTASTVDGALTATTVSSSGGPLSLTAGGTGALTIGTANALGAITATTANGTLNVINAVTSSGAAVTLTAGGANALTFNSVTGVGANLTSGAALALGTVNANAGTATLTAAGAITDAAGTTPSVAANQLTITSATSVDLDTNVGTLNATGVTGTLTIRELNALAVANANAAGTVSLSTVNGALNVTNATSTGGALTLASNGGALTVGTGAGTGATLTSSGAITLGTVTTTGGTTTLNAAGAITDAAGPTASVVANQLTINAAGSADLDTNVNSLVASGVAGALTVREQTGALTVASANANGAINVSTINGALTVTSATSTAGTVTAAAGGGGALSVAALAGTGATLTGGAMTLGGINVAGGTVTLTATGAIADAANATASILANQLTIAGAGSVDLDTNINTLNATGVTGTLAVREQTGALAVANANAAGAVNVSTVGGALTVANATSSGGAMTLAAGGGNALTVTTASGAAGATLTGSTATVGTVNAGTGVATVTAAGDLQVTTATGTGVTLTSGAVLTAGTVNSGTGALNMTATGALNLTSATSTGATLNSGAVLTANTVNAGSGALNMTSTGALNLTTGSGGSATLNSGAALTIGTLGVGAGSASLTAVGALNDGGTVTALSAGTTTLSAASIGTTANPFNTSVTSLTSASTAGSTYIREANDILLTDLTAATNQDIVIGAIGDITVARIMVDGSNGDGRVLLAAGSDIFSVGAGTHITAQDVELRAGGLDTTGGRAGAGNILRINAPQFVAGSDDSDVPSVVLIQNQSAADPNVAAQPNQVEMVAGQFEIATVTLNPALQTVDGYLTTRFSDRTAGIGEEINFNNLDFLTSGRGTAVLGNINQNSLSNASDAASNQGEGALYVDWASFDPNISLFGTVNPPICLPRDQQDDDSGESTEGAPDSGAGSGGGSGCASSTAQYDNHSLGLPELRLVLTEQGMQWVRVRVRVPMQHSGGPLRVAQSR